MKFSVIAASILFYFSFAASLTHAQTVKKWVDEDGVTHYSDQEPATGGAKVKEIEVPETNLNMMDTKDANERVQQQLQQLERDRKAREREARKKETARALEEAQERAPLIPEVKKKKKKKKGSSPGGPYPKPRPGISN